MNYDTVVTDLETLALAPESVVLSVGLIAFDSTVVQEFDDLVTQGTNIYLDKHIQIADGRLVLQSTLEFWEQQGEAASFCLDPPAEVVTYPLELRKEIKKFYSEFKINPNKARVYCRGPQFDIAKLDSLLNQYGHECPWHYRRPRCSRTFMEDYGYADSFKTQRPEGMIPHNSQHDAAFEAWIIQRIMNGIPIPEA
jgi:hypothetical protein